MGLGYDGSIRINTKINSSGFAQGLNDMSQSMGRFNESMKKSIGSMSRGIGGLTESVKRAAGVIAAAFGAAAIIDFGREAVQAASNLSDAWMGLESIVEGQGKSFGKAKSFINDYISDGLVPLENAVTSYKNLAARGYDTEQIEKVMAALKDAAAFGRQSSYTLGEAVETATEGLKNENSILVDNAGVTKNVAKMWDEYANSIGTTANNLTQEQKIQAEVNGILEETKFQIGDAAKLAGTYSGQIAMLSFNFQQLKVAVGDALLPIAQAVLPGINAIIAALTKLARMFAKVSAMLFGKSTKVVATGQKAIADTGIAAAGSTDKLADSLGRAGSAAKKAAEDMETAIAPFDEFNIIAFSAAKNAGGAGGGAGGGGGAADFGIPDVDTDIEEYEAVQEEFNTLADLFVKMLDDMLAAMPRLKQALLDFADAFNDLNRKLYEAFKDPRIVERIEELGRQLADALNAMVSAIDWNLWGRTLGAGLNLGLQFLTEFLYAFNWMNLGRQLAGFVNGLASEIDWYDFGRLLWAGFKISLETLAGFLIGLDMPLMAEAASKTVMGFFDEMKNTIQRIPWDEIGTQIARFLNHVDWYGAITSIFAAIAAAITALKDLVSNFVATLRWSDIAKQIYTAINDSLEKVDWRGLGKVLGDLFVKAFHFLREVIAGINWFQIGRDIAEFMNGIDFGEVASAVYNLLCAAIDAAIELLAGFISKADNSSIVAAFALFFGGRLLSSISKHIKDFAGKIFSTLKTALVAVFTGRDLIDVGGFVGKLAQVFAIARSSAFTFAEAIKMVFGPGSIVAGIASIIGGAVLAIKNFLSMLKNGFSWVKEALMLIGIAITAVGAVIMGVPATVAAAVAGAVAALSTLLASFDELVHFLTDYFAPKIEECGGNVVLGFLKGIADAMAGIGSWIQEHFVNPFIHFFCNLLGIHSPSTVFAGFGKNIVEGLLQGIRETWFSIPEFLQEKISAIKELFSSAWESIKKKTSEAWNNIKKTVGTIWDSIKEKANTIFDAIKQKISEIWDNLKEKTSAIWEGIKTFLSTTWENLKNAATAKFENIKTVISTAWENVKSKTAEIWNSIRTLLSTTWENLKSAAKTAFESIRSTISSIWDSIRQKIIEVWTTIRNEAVSKWNEIASTISNQINNIKAKVSEGFTRVKETVTSKVTETIDALKNKDWTSVGRSIVNGISNGLNGIFDKLKRWATDVWNSVTNAFNSGSRSSSSGSRRNSRSVSSYRMAAIPEAVSTYQLPKLANGAVIPPNQQFAAILGDQRSGINIEAPLSTIETALQNVLDRYTGSGDIHITVESVLDGRVIARNTVTHINNMTRSAGKPVLLY